MRTRAKGVFSSALVPESDRDRAVELLIVAMEIRGLTLTEITESIVVDPQTIDPDDPENKSWLEWYFEVKQAGCVCFDPWQFFDLESE